MSIKAARACCVTTTFTFLRSNSFNHFKGRGTRRAGRRPSYQIRLSLACLRMGEKKAAAVVAKPACKAAETGSVVAFSPIKPLFSFQAGGGQFTLMIS